MNTQKTILIADEERAVVEELAESCRQLGLNVQTAYDGLATITNFLFAQPDISCIGVNLCGPRGSRVCNTIVSESLRSSIPVITLYPPEDGSWKPDALSQTDAEVVYLEDERTYPVAKTDDLVHQVEQQLIHLLKLDENRCGQLLGT